MSLSNDTLMVLVARRDDLYERLRVMDGQVAAAQNSPFFGTRPVNAVTMCDSIEAVEERIADINRQLEPARGRNAEGASPAADSGGRQAPAFRAARNPE